jgi:hypothetical protein
MQYREAATDEISYGQLGQLTDGQTMLVLFHNKKRCYQCLQMEQFVSELINEKFQDAVDEQKLAFKTLIMDDPENRALVEQFGIFAATLVLMEFKNDQLTYARILPEATELYRNEVDFKQYLNKELSEIVANDHE